MAVAFAEADLAGAGLCRAEPHGRSGGGTATGAAVGAGGGAAIAAGTGYGRAGKGALIGLGVEAAASAIYDITKHNKQPAQ